MNQGGKLRILTQEFFNQEFRITAGLAGHVDRQKITYDITSYFHGFPPTICAPALTWRGETAPWPPRPKCSGWRQSLRRTSHAGYASARPPVRFPAALTIDSSTSAPF